MSYPATGADVNQLIIGLGQRIGLGIMSKETAADLDPFVNNPEGEKDQIVAEGLQQALMAGVQQQAASGQMPPATIAKLIQMVGSDQMELAEAMTAVAAEALEAQREAQEMEDEEMSLDQAMAPANLAAMAGPQGPQSMPATRGPSPDQQNMMSMLSTMRRPQTSSGGV